MYNIEEKIKDVAIYVVENGSTVRQAAKKFKLSKSTVHNYISCKVERIDSVLALQAKAVLQKNKQERHIRGGRATKLKYEPKNT